MLWGSGVHVERLIRERNRVLMSVDLPRPLSPEKEEIRAVQSKLEERNWRHERRKVGVKKLTKKNNFYSIRYSVYVHVCACVCLMVMIHLLLGGMFWSKVGWVCGQWLPIQASRSCLSNSCTEAYSGQPWISLKSLLINPMNSATTRIQFKMRTSSHKKNHSIQRLR